MKPRRLKASGIPLKLHLSEQLHNHIVSRGAANCSVKPRTCYASPLYTNCNTYHSIQRNGRQTRSIPEQSGRFCLGHAHQLLQSRRQLHPRRRERRRMGVVFPHLEMGSHGMQLTLKFPVLKSKFIDGLWPAQVQLLQSHRPWRNPNISAFCAI